MKQAEDFLCRLCSVFDGVHSILQSDLDTLWALYMGGDWQAQTVGLITGSFHQLRGHAFSLLLGVQHTASDHQLNQVRLVLGNLLDKAGSFLRGMGFIGQGTGHMTARDGNCHVARQNPGTDNLAH